MAPSTSLYLISSFLTDDLIIFSKISAIMIATTKMAAAMTTLGSQAITPVKNWANSLNPRIRAKIIKKTITKIHLMMAPTNSDGLTLMSAPSKAWRQPLRSKILSKLIWRKIRATILPIPDEISHPKMNTTKPMTSLGKNSTVPCQTF